MPDHIKNSSYAAEVPRLFSDVLASVILRRFDRGKDAYRTEWPKTLGTLIWLAATRRAAIAAGLHRSAWL